MGYNLLVNGVYWGYNLLTNLLLTSWDIQVSDPLNGYIRDLQRLVVWKGRGGRITWDITPSL